MKLKAKLGGRDGSQGRKKGRLLEAYRLNKPPKGTVRKVVEGKRGELRIRAS